MSSFHNPHLVRLNPELESERKRVVINTDLPGASAQDAIRHLRRRILTSLYTESLVDLEETRTSLHRCLATRGGDSERLSVATVNSVRDPHVEDLPLLM